MMDPTVLRLLLVVLAIAAVTVVGRVLAARRDELRVVADDERHDRPVPHTARTRSASEDLGHAAGPSAILFGSPTCAPCDTVKLLLGEVADERDDFTWRYVDAAAHLDLARAHGVRRVPTLIVMDADDHTVARSGGVPTRAALREAVALAADGSADADASAADARSGGSGTEATVAGEALHRAG